MHCIYKDNLVPYPMPGATLPARVRISGSRRAIQVNTQAVDLYRAEAKISNPDSEFAWPLGHLGVVCGDQKYSNTIPKPTAYVHF